MESRRPSGLFAEKLSLFLSYAEIAALLLSFAGLAFFYLHYTGAREFIIVGFSALSITYFLWGFTVPDNQTSEGEPSGKVGFIDLFVKVMGKKVIFLGCSVSIIGLLFGYLGLTGSNQLVLVGGIATIAASLLACLAILIDNSSLPYLKGALTRAVPIGLLAASWLYRHWN